VHRVEADSIWWVNRINETKKEIEKVSEGKVETKVLILDLASFEATKKAAQEVLSYDIAIDVWVALIRSFPQ